MFEFVQFVTSQDMFQMQGEQTRCLSKKCKCKVFKLVDDVMRDVYEEGFMPNYYWWTNHSEELPQFPPVVLQGSYYGSGGRREELNPYEQMIRDHAGPSIGKYIEKEGVIKTECMEENPNPEAQNFFDMLATAQASFSEGCEHHSKLSASLACLSLKSDYNMPEGCFNCMVQLMGNTMPKKILWWVIFIKLRGRCRN